MRTARKIFRWAIIILAIMGIALIALSYHSATTGVDVKTILRQLISETANSPAKWANFIYDQAGIFFIDSTTREQLQKDYIEAQNGNSKIKILIVPGHDDQNFGTIFRGLQESEINLGLAQKLAALFGQEEEFETFLLRDENGYKKSFLDYLSAHKEEIASFRRENKNLMEMLVQQGLVEDTEWIVHNYAPRETAIMLYGINKWANDNQYDLVIHVHFNDHPGRRYNTTGKYSGFSIYIPEKQYSNAKGSRTIAESVFNQMKKYFAVSDMPKEREGIIEDQKLIAIGSYNTLDAAALLIEYGYIYEPQFINPRIRPVAEKELALQTFLGIKNFFEKKKEEKVATLPYRWKSNLGKGLRGNKDVFAIQVALTVEGIYPPLGFTKNDCPINGNFGNCTTIAIKRFQQKYGIKPVLGFIGPLTRAELNKLYSN